MTLRLRLGRFLWKNSNFNGKIYKKVLNGRCCLMKEEIFQIHRYSVGYKIDKQLLLSLKDIFVILNIPTA